MLTHILTLPEQGRDDAVAALEAWHARWRGSISDRFILDAREVMVTFNDLIGCHCHSMRRNIFDFEPKQEKVIFANGIKNFDISAIISTDSQRPVHHKLHIAGTGRLFTGC